MYLFRSVCHFSITVIFCMFRFSLTKKGEELAQQLFNDLNNNGSSLPKKTTSVNPTTISLQNDYHMYVSDDEIDLPPIPSVSGLKTKSPVKQKPKKSPTKKTLVISDSDDESIPDLKITKTKSPKKFKSPRKKIYPASVSDSDDETSTKHQQNSPIVANIDCVDLTDDNVCNPSQLKVCF